MRKTLVILAAGIGSRFGGGIKQLEPVDAQGHIIIDYSIHDAISVGFSDIIFIIRYDIYDDFMEAIGERIERVCEKCGVHVAYAFQELDRVPIKVPEGRVKPWGTGHAVMMTEGLADGPFAVINADDYYGKESFEKAAKMLEKGDYGLIGYGLLNTLSDSGAVTRGICKVAGGRLAEICETRNIVKTSGGAAADGKALDTGSIVSMNFWCYPKEFFGVLKRGFPEFLENMEDPMKDEYLLPDIAARMLNEGTEFTVAVTHDHWLGITYPEDRKKVRKGFSELIGKGIYEKDLYSDL